MSSTRATVVLALVLLVGCSYDFDQFAKEPTGSGGSGATGGGSSGSAGGGNFDCAAVSGTTSNGHCYFAVGTGAGMTWTSAQAACIASDAHLATVTSAQEQTFAAQTFSGANDTWIGLSLADPSTLPDSSCSGDPPSCPFLWVTNETLSYTNWAKYSDTDFEPNYTGACVRIQSNDSTWADQDCTVLLPGICEGDG